MGKGGQQAQPPAVVASSSKAILSSNISTFSSNGACNNNNKGWRSPYNPLDPQAPPLPTKGEIKAVIPEACFHRSFFWSFFYLFRDIAITTGFLYAASQYLNADFPTLQYPLFTTTDVVIENARTVVTWIAAWSTYAFWMGTIWTGPWVLAHECGHGAFSDSQFVNDVVGFVLHQGLLVPYFAWQYTHAKHHRRTNHLTDGESHVPSTAKDNGLVQSRRESFYAAWHEAMGDGAFAVFQIWTHLGLGWPLYLLGLASTGKLAADGTPLDDRIADHFRPNSPMFPPKVRAKILLSTVTEILTLAALVYAGFQYGHLKVFLWYWCPYFYTNAWLVLYTWLQHTDPSIPHYGEGQWTWVKGALSTIDRDYGIFDFFHHRIGSTHVVHHLFHEMPWYNAKVATHHVKAFLEPKGLYNYDPTYWPLAMWKVANTCHYVESDEGIQYLKSFNDVPRSNAQNKEKKAN
jgi:omega-6 fatty acid desaturase (delta-12 desaturase)